MQSEVTLVNECDVYSRSPDGLLKSRLWLVSGNTGDKSIEEVRGESIELAYTENQAEIARLTEIISRALQHLGFIVKKEEAVND